MREDRQAVRQASGKTGNWRGRQVARQAKGGVSGQPLLFSSRELRHGKAARHATSAARRADE